MKGKIMAFESLAEKLQKVFKNLRGKGRLSESDVKIALKEVKMALLEADVSFKVVKQFIASVSERAIGQEVFNSLSPGQTVVKIVNEEMIHLMGESVQPDFKPSDELTVFLVVGLQGAGKTTTIAKMAGKFKNMGKKPLLVACDIYRPAAIKQLQVNGEKQGVPVFTMGDQHSPVDIAKASLSFAKKNDCHVILLDTAGRLHVDEMMMAELQEIKKNIPIHQTILVVDSMTGQDAINVASTFEEQVGLDGVVLTKLDGDTRGGVALSLRFVTGKPIFYVGMGEKLSELEEFHPDRMASRILGMGDILTLINKVQSEVDEEQAKVLEQKIRKAEFNYNDFLLQLKQIKNMGGIAKILDLMPGMDKVKSTANLDDETPIRQVESMIYSMTKGERENPDLLNLSRKQRIAKGSGVAMSEVNRMVKQFEQSKKMMKQMSGMMQGKKSKFKFPFSF